MSFTTTAPLWTTVKRWTGIGLLLIGIYLIFPITITQWSNWWACFIFLPAVFLITLAGVMSERCKYFSPGARAVFIPGLILAVIALMFVFRLSWAIYWPLMIIVPMAGVLSLTVPFSKNHVTSFFQEWVFWFSLAGLFLGLEFLLARLEILQLFSLPFRWWSLNIFMVFLGGIWIAVRMILNKNHWMLVFLNLSLTICVGFSGLISFFNLNWNMLVPLYLLCIGSLMIASCFFPGKTQSTKGKE